jgi:hypothetical protein
MSKTFYPIHEDKNLDIEWWTSRGCILGESNKRFAVYVNAVRDASGRYDGFIVIDKWNKIDRLITVKTVEQAESILTLMLLMEKK